MRRTTIIKWVGAMALLLFTAACAHLLGLSGEREKFAHRAHVLEGISCVTCHTGMEDAGEVGALHIPKEESCVSAGCHVEPHDERPCFGCHTESTTKMRVAANRENLRFRHDLHLERVPGQCVRCHTGVARDDESLATPMAQCFSCHPHEDQFAIRDCEGCHVNLYAEGSMPSEHFVHDLDFDRRHGVQAANAADLCATCHQESFCASCHGVTVPTLPARMNFDKPLGDKLHRAGFMARHSIEARIQNGLCTTCHQEQFCTTCHLDRGIHALSAAAPSPHPAGWLDRHGPAARRDPIGCSTCHGGGGEQLCIGCHRVGSAGGSIHPPGWSSRKSRSDAPCRQCHVL